MQYYLVINLAHMKYYLLLLVITFGQAQEAMVVSARVEASEIGIAILKKGGNAFDAMCATELALAVAYPYAGNIGGGGFMVYRKANGEIGSLDYREKAPLKAFTSMYLDRNGIAITNLSTEGALSVAVPGTIAGIFAVHKKFGRLSLNDIFEPAINLAKRGIVVTQLDVNHINASVLNIIKVSGNETLMSRSYKIGDTIKQPQLAITLATIAKSGRNGFYKGETAKQIVAFLQSKGGIISMKDLKKYKVVWRKPAAFVHKDLRIISMGLPSSGGFVLQQIMKMIAPFDINKMGHNSTEMIQVLVEAERRAYADRNHFLGDPSFVNVPQKKLLSDAYLKKRMSDFSFQKATLSSNISHGNITIGESNETTHYSIVDSDGNAVAATTTLNGAYGSKLYSQELGFFFNNQMDDFSVKPGQPNSYGLIGAEANSIAPQKRMLSSMTPTIVEKNGQLFMVLGSPGGSTIITSVLQTILNVTEFGMSMQTAVDAPRFHHQWLPDTVIFEPNKFDKSVLDNLLKKGYKIDQKNATILGKVDAILVLPNKKLQGGADSRGDDAAVWY